MKSQPFAVISVILFSCHSTPTETMSWDITGSWYTNGRDGGTYDSVIDYVEVHINDSTLWYHDERFGQSSEQRYYVKADTLFKCFDTSEPCEYIPMYVLIKQTNDTLWLSINKNYTNHDPDPYWVKLPAGEVGPGELAWTKENRDSLSWKLLYDYDRRKYKYYLTLAGNLARYDSFVRAGQWDWSMKEIRESEKREEDYLRNQ